MPKKPRYIERKFPPIQDKPPIKVRLYLATTKDKKTTFVFGYHDLHEKPKDAQQMAGALDGAVRGSVINVLGQLLDPNEIGVKKNPAPITYKKTPGRQYVYQFNQNGELFVVTARVFIGGKRQYQLSCIMAEKIFDDTLAAKFLNSFRIIVPESDLPPRPKMPQ